MLTRDTLSGAMEFANIIRGQGELDREHAIEVARHISSMEEHIADAILALVNQLWDLSPEDRRRALEEARAELVEIDRTGVEAEAADRRKRQIRGSVVSMVGNLLKVDFSKRDSDG